MYRIFYRRSVEKDLEDLPGQMLKRVIARIEGLSEDPRPKGAVKLKGGPADLFRVRAGEYRIIYEIREREVVVLVVKVGHRRDVYSDR